MNTKKISYYVAEYVGTFPMCILHEVSHFIFAFITFLLGLNSFPIIKITRYFSVEIDEKEGTSDIFYNRMHVEYNTWLNRREQDILSAILASAPVFLTILLFIFSNEWMYLYYLSNISSLWLSVNDIAQIKKAFTFKTKIIIESEKKNNRN